jgi:hypothetical protein
MLAGLGLPAFAAEPAPSARAASREPTDFSVRGELRNEYVDLQDGGGENMIVPRVDYAYSPAVSFRVEAPLVTSGPDLAGGNNQSGFGDLLLRGSYRAWEAPGYAAVVGAELILDTASHASIGDGKDVLAPLAFASVNLPRHDSVVFPLIQYYFTLGGDDSRPDVHYTSIKSALLTRWSKGYYTIVEPQLVIDHERADKLGLTLEGELGRFLNRRLALWGRPGIGLYGDDLPAVYNWNLQVGVRYTLN